MRLAVPAGALLVLAWGVAGPAPASVLDEIRSLLREQALVVPAGERLDALTEEDLAAGLASIDPHARHFKAADYRAPLHASEAWTGIGADLVQDGQEVLLDVYQGGAADRVGIPDRARVVEIEGVPVAGLPMDAIVARLRGEAGTRVAIGLVLPDGGRARAHVERERFVPLDVELLQPGGARVIRLREFVPGITLPALVATLDFERQTHRQGDVGPLVIDLRDATGGDLYEAFDLAGLFLPAGTHLGSLRAREGVVREVRATGGRKFAMPLVLLVGPDTASAAEVFAGVLQSHGRARLLGRQTYGKCSSQTDARLSDGSVLRYTNREVVLPDGKSCSNVGLMPDHEATPQLLSDLSSLAAWARDLVELDRDGAEDAPIQ